jgi:hypothetical protein
MAMLPTSINATAANTEKGEVEIPRLLESANWWFGISWYGLLISGSLAALAATATVAFLFVQFWSSSVRDKYAEQRTSTLEFQTASAQRDTARLSAEAESAKAQIAEAQARAAEANQKAEEDRLARVKIEEYLAPRAILQDQGERIVEKVKPFAGTPFDVAIDPAVEAELPSTLINMLGLGAGWKWHKYPNSNTVFPPGVGILVARRGLQIRYNRSRSDDFSAPASALRAALSAEGYETGIVVDPPDSPLASSPDAIHIEIGRKP